MRYSIRRPSRVPTHLLREPAWWGSLARHTILNRCARPLRSGVPWLAAAVAAILGVACALNPAPAAAFECEVDSVAYFVEDPPPPPPPLPPPLPPHVVLRLHVHKVLNPDESDDDVWTDGEIDSTIDVLAADLAPFGIHVEVVGRSEQDGSVRVHPDEPNEADIDFFAGPAAAGYAAMQWLDLPNNSAQDRLHLYFGSKYLPEGCGVDGEYHASGAAVVGGGLTEEGGSAVVYGEDSIGRHILSHEVGHVLGLPHTQGDPFSDTGSDPNLRQVNCCNVEGGALLVNSECEYTFTAEQDSCSGKDLSLYDPDTRNIMSYTHPYCHAHFSEEQGAEMRERLRIDPWLQTRWRLPDFANRSADTGFDYSPTPYSAIALDYDEDGRMDLLLSSVDGFAGLMENSLNTSTPEVPLFLNVASDEFGQANIPEDTRGLAVADFDNDGDLDLLFTSVSDPKVFEHDAAAQNRFTDISSTFMHGGTFTSNADSSWAAAWGDYDRDGHVDLYIGRAGGTSTASSGLRDVLLRNQGDGTFAQVTGLVGLSAAPHLTTTGVAWVDANEDGELDLVVAGAGASEPFLLIAQSVTSTPEDEYEHSFASLDTLAEGIRGVSVRDLDNDGHLDLVLAASGSGSDGSRILWGSGSSFDSPTLLGDGFAASGVAMADLGLNGATDVLLTPAGSADAPAVFVNDADASLKSFLESGQFLGLATATPMSFRAVALADFAGSGGTPDGDLDLYLGRAASSDAFFYQNARNGVDVPASKWLKVKVASDTLHANNNDGVGSVVRVEATLPGPVELVQTQVVDGGSGVGSQASNELVFGLGNAVGGVEVFVTWPDGSDTTVVVSSESLQSTLTVQESRTTVGLLPESILAYVLMDPLGDASWTFEWETSYLSDPSEDVVRVWFEGTKPGCSIAAVTLEPSDVDVTHNVFAKTDGGYLHRLAWDGRECATGCSYKYRVLSAVSSSATADSSAVKTLSISSCISN